MGHPLLWKNSSPSSAFDWVLNPEKGFLQWSSSIKMTWSISEKPWKRQTLKNTDFDDLHYCQPNELLRTDVCIAGLLFVIYKNIIKGIFNVYSSQSSTSHILYSVKKLLLYCKLQSKAKENAFSSKLVRIQDKNQKHICQRRRANI